MSEKQIIYILEHLWFYVDEFGISEYKGTNLDNGTYLDFVAENAVKDILKLYKIEKEKNKNLELCLKAEENYLKGFFEDIKLLFNIKPNNNFISKDKIKANIEELESIYKQEVNQKYNGNYYQQLKYAIQVLQELLNESEE